ncbi:MAG: Abortive infection protein [Myxococcales bacterium]|nr:Abortive infection protein [Myxococcales bacterium]
MATEPPDPSAPAGGSIEARIAGRDALIAWAVVAVCVLGFVQIHFEINWVGDLGSALIAVTFLYAPVFMAWRRHEDLDDYGFHFGPGGAEPPPQRGFGARARALWALLTSKEARRSGFTAVAAMAVIFPIFTLGYFAFYEVACNSHLLAHLVPRGMCGHYGGLHGLHAPEITQKLLTWCGGQFIVVALPEELFFRGFLLHLLEKRFPPKRRWLGGGVGLALVLSAIAFALIHLPKDGDPRALATFFPALLFGWMRSATGSIFASTLTHGASNVLIRFLELTVLR